MPPEAPHSNDAEMSVLGAILLDPGTLDEVADILKPGDFFAPRHGAIYAAMRAVQARGLPLETLAICDEWSRAERGQAEPAYVSGLADAVSGAALACYHARRVADLARARDFLALARTAQEGITQNPGHARETLDRFEADLLRLRLTGERGGPRLLSDLREPFFRRLRERREKKQAGGLPTGFRDLDALTCGLFRREMAVLAARPSMGKSALGFNVGQNVAQGGGGVLGFSLEMAEEAIYGRVISRTSGIDSDRIRRAWTLADAHVGDLEDAADRLDRLPPWIDDESDLALSDIVARTRRLHARHPLALVIVDYAQLVEPEEGDRAQRERQVAKVSKGLKAMAKRLDVAVLALCQLNREVELGRVGGDGSGKPPKKRLPTKAMLRESGAWEQDADLIMLLHREDVYREDRGERERDYLADLVIAKARNGRTGHIELRWFGERSEFGDLVRAGGAAPREEF